MRAGTVCLLAAFALVAAGDAWAQEKPAPKPKAADQPKETITDASGFYSVSVPTFGDVRFVVRPPVSTRLAQLIFANTNAAGALITEAVSRWGPYSGPSRPM